MSDVFALDPTGNDVLRQQAAENPIDTIDQPPGFWTKTPMGIGMGIMRGGAKAARGVAVASGALVSLADEAVHGPDSSEWTDPYFKAVDDYANNAVDFWTPNANEVGTAGRILGGLSEIALPLMAGGGNPTLMLGGQELGGAMDLSRQGVGAKTAVAGGILEGAASAAGFRLPILGKTLAQRLATGAAGNLGLGVASRAGEGLLLDQTGNQKLAEDYKPWDMTSLGVDLLSGLAFGGIHHIGSKPVMPSERDAALAALNAKHFQDQTAPGTPTDVSASAAHQAAMEQAIEQLLRGEPATAPEAVQNALFAPREEAAPAQLPLDLQQLDAERSIGRPELKIDIPSGENITAAQLPIEAKFREQIGTDPDAAMAAYAKLEDAKGGKVLNTDTARELSPDYLKNRTLSAVVHEPASALVKYMYAKKLAEAPADGEENMVLFTGGGTGAGKSTAVRKTLGLIADRAQIVYDANLDHAPKAIGKIQQALDAGKSIKVAYVYRDPIEALRLGALTRAMKQEAKYNTGRTIPIDTHAKTHTGSNAAIHDIATHFAGDPRVDIQIIDNSRGKDNPGIIDLGNLPKLDYNSVREEAIKALHDEHAAGRISESVYRGFAGPEAHPAEGQSAAVGSGTGGQPEPQRQEQRADGLSEPAPSAAKPEELFAVTAARQAAESLKLQIPTGEFRVDGSPVTMTAREILARGDAAIAKAQADAKGFEAAANCFLQNGLG